MPTEPSAWEELPPSDAEAEAKALFGLGLEGSGEPEEGDQPGDRIGGFELLRPLGEGGFGMVWSVRQHEPIQREAALKLIKPGMDSRRIIARFGAERRALAAMDHPNIAAVFDAGTTTDGRPYFVMEMVKGKALTVHCDRRRLGIRERLELFIPVCQAVQHAHQKSILHRDLKPSNILVAEIDGRAVPKVIDFGIAKALGLSGEEEVSLLRTLEGSLIGTLQYMSPEQAGSVPDVDTRSDVYSLGVILYELLTGLTPLTAKSGTLTPCDETLRRIRSEEARQPSRCLSPVTDVIRKSSERRGTDSGRLGRTLRGDLDWIVMKALEKDRGRRYDTVNALAADLGRHLRGDPVSAAAPTWSYRAGKFAKRNALALGAGGMVAAALIAGTAVSLWQAQAAKEASRSAEISRNEADASRRLAEKNGAEAEANFTRARDAVNRYLNLVTDNPRLNDSDFFSLRQELLETAVPFYEELTRTAGPRSSPAFRTEQAGALARLGEIYRNTGAMEKARVCFQREIGLQEDLAAEFPGEVKYLRAIAIAQDHLGKTLASEDDRADGEALLVRTMEIFARIERIGPLDRETLAAKASVLLNLAQKRTSEDGLVRGVKELREGLAIQEQLSQDAPDDIKGREVLISLKTILATYLITQQDRSGEAETLVRSTLAMQTQLIARFPGSYRYRLGQASASHNLAQILTSDGRSDEALKLATRAQDEVTALTREYPSLDGLLEVLGDYRRTAAGILQVLGRKEEAKRALEAALEVMRPLVREHPERMDRVHHLSVTLGEYGAVQESEGRLDEALGIYGEAEDLMKKVMNARPLNLRYQLEWQRLAVCLAAAFEKARQPLKAIDIAMQIPLEPALGWESHAHAAWILALTLGELKGDSGAADARRPELEHQVAERIVALMKSAGQLGDPYLAQMARDPRMAPFLEGVDLTGPDARPAAEENGGKEDGR